MSAYKDQVDHALSDTVEIDENDAFMVSQDATLSYQLRAATVSSSNFFLRGVIYEMDIKLARVTGSTGGTVITSLHKVSGKDMP